jgi:hypothetical protein
LLTGLDGGDLLIGLDGGDVIMHGASDRLAA